MDDKSNRGAQDRARINLNEDYEVRYWTQALSCTSEQLRAAVQVAGSSAEKVRAHLAAK